MVARRAAPLADELIGCAFLEVAAAPRVDLGAEASDGARRAALICHARIGCRDVAAWLAAAGGDARGLGILIVVERVGRAQRHRRRAAGAIAPCNARTAVCSGGAGRAARHADTRIGRIDAGVLDRGGSLVALACSPQQQRSHQCRAFPARHVRSGSVSRTGSGDHRFGQTGMVVGLHTTAQKRACGRPDDRVYCRA